MVLLTFIILDILVLAVISNRNYLFTSWLGILLGGLAVVTMMDTDIFTVLFALADHTGALLLGALTYLLIGVGWSMFKWWRKAKFVAEKCREYEAHWRANHSTWDEAIDTRPWHPYAVSGADWNSKTGKYSYPALEHKYEIVCWMSLWVFSMLGTAIDNLVVNLFNNIFEQLKNSYQRISDSAFEDINTSNNKE